MIKAIDLPSNKDIFEENRVADALGWMRTYVKSHPDWVPDIEQLGKMSKRFKLTEGCLLRLYERLIDEMQMEKVVKDVIEYLGVQSHFDFHERIGRSISIGNKE